MGSFLVDFLIQPLDTRFQFGNNQDLKVLIECVVKSLAGGQDNVEIFPKGRGILPHLRSCVR
jgi:hypothetical protein